MSDCDFGLIGLAVMGENLALNVESRGYRVAVYNRTTSKVDEFISGRAKGKRFAGCHSPEELVASLKTPRIVMMMVKAGPAVDNLIETLLPLLSSGEILVDGGENVLYVCRITRRFLEGSRVVRIGRTENHTFAPRDGKENTFRFHSHYCFFQGKS